MYFGTHKGLIHYTIGQRKGLGIAHETPLYVVDLNFTVDIDRTKPIKVSAKIRYGAKEGAATLYPEENGKVKVEFEEPQRAITRGQSVVFYIDDVLIGGGKII